MCAFLDLDRNYKDYKYKEDDFKNMARRFYEQGNEYYESSIVILSRNRFLCNAIVSNASFACELYLKSLLYYNSIQWQDGLKGAEKHDLQYLFNKLPIKVIIYIKEKIKLNQSDDFDLLLKENKQAFTRIRYSCEVYEICFNSTFSLLFADILKFCCEFYAIKNDDIKENLIENYYQKYLKMN